MDATEDARLAAWEEENERMIRAAQDEAQSRHKGRLTDWDTCDGECCAPPEGYDEGEYEDADDVERPGSGAGHDYYYSGRSDDGRGGY